MLFNTEPGMGLVWIEMCDDLVDEVTNTLVGRDVFTHGHVLNVGSDEHKPLT